MHGVVRTPDHHALPGGNVNRECHANPDRHLVPIVLFEGIHVGRVREIPHPGGHTVPAFLEHRGPGRLAGHRLDSFDIDALDRDGNRLAPYLHLHHAGGTKEHI
jgi:hypothetical protein